MKKTIMRNEATISFRINRKIAWSSLSPFHWGIHINSQQATGKMQKSEVFKTTEVPLPEVSLGYPKVQAYGDDQIGDSGGTTWHIPSKPRMKKTKMNNKLECALESTKTYRDALPIPVQLRKP